MKKKTDWTFGLDLASDAVWTKGMREGFEERDLGIKRCTNGDYIAKLVRRTDQRMDPDLKKWHLHEVDLQMVYVLRGWAKFEYAGQGVRTLREGDCLAQLPMIEHRELECSDDWMVLEIVSPANFETRLVDAPEDTVDAAD